MQLTRELDGPTRDPLDVAAEQAARRLANGLPLSDADWEALKAKATNELMEYDARHYAWN